MCGAFGLINLTEDEFAERYQLNLPPKLDQPLFQARFSPHTFIPSISRQSPNQLVLRYWSIMPTWIKNTKDLRYPTFNARAETVHEKPTFKHAWENAQRCLIPSTHFFEWQKIKKNNKIVERQPYSIKLHDEKVLSLAGLYEPWQDIETCTIITTDANHDLKDIHQRMPVIIDHKVEEQWLDPSTPLSTVAQLLQPLPDGELNIEAVEL